MMVRFIGIELLVFSLASGGLSYVRSAVTDERNTNVFPLNQKNGFNTRIIGGESAPVGEYPWFTNLSGCGGMLVAPEFVLTAAHCAPNLYLNQQIEIGALCYGNSNINCGQPYEIVRIKNIFKHPDYSHPETQNPSHDFMLLELDRAVTSISPVNMDDGTYSPTYKNGKELWAIGFGVTNTALASLSDRLLHVNVKYVQQGTCNVSYGGLIKSSMMCASDVGKDSCQGDSGGPLFDKENNVLVGVTSWGYSCADPDYPGVYARISDQWDWIFDNICVNSSDNGMPSFCAGFATKAPTKSPSPTVAPTPCTALDALDINAKFRTDDHPEQSSWSIMNLQSGVVVASGRDFDEKNKNYNENLCLQNEICYQFTVYDHNGDGLVSPGGYNLIADGQSIASGSAFDHQQAVTFGDCETSCKPSPVRLVLNTDSYGYETKWTISSATSDHGIYDGGHRNPHSDLQTYDLTMDVCEGCYIFRIFDAFGDGLEDTGNYTLYFGDAIYSGGDFTFAQSFHFGDGCSSVFQENDIISVSLDVDVLGDGAELSWRIEEEGGNIVASDSYSISTTRSLSLPRKCYTFRVVDSGNTEGGFVYWLTVDDEIVVFSDFGGDFEIGCEDSSGSSLSTTVSVMITAAFLIFQLGF